MRIVPCLAMLALLLGYTGQGRTGAGAERDYFRSSRYDEPLRSVEFQYFRFPRDKWGPLLTRMAQYNADCVSTYVHWGWHEMEEGDFDFTGRTRPERDLAGFLDLCAERGLKVILKPGPFIDAETNAGGVPHWLIRDYPETAALDKRGKPYMHGDSGMPRVSYLHPLYLELVRRYYGEVAKVAVPRQWPDGPIVAVQVDNETPGDGFVTLSNYLTHNFKADYNAYQVQTAWPEWLKDKYGSVQRLNAAHGSAYSSFRDAPMPSRWNDPRSGEEFQIYLDLDEFAEWQYVEALRRYREALIEVGFYAPTFQDLLCMPWDMAGMLGDLGGMAEASGGWLGTNVYAEVYRPWTIFTGDLVYKYNWDEYVHMAVWRTSLSGTLSSPYPAFVPEITCSRRLYFQAPIAWGADAANIYVGLQARPDNREVAPGRSWGMEACVTPEGRTRDCFWNGKLTYLFMERSGGFLPGRERPRLAVGYSHKPERAWNWDFRFNFNRPHRRTRHKALAEFTRGANLAERSMLIAGDLVKRHAEFDVVHLDHLKPGQIGEYEILALPEGSRKFFDLEAAEGMEDGPEVFWYGEGRGYRELEEMARRKGVVLKRAWTDADEVDVIERRGPPGSPVILSVVNRGAGPFDGPVFFAGGASDMRLAAGAKTASFVSIADGGLRAALLDDPRGGRVEYGEDEMSFTGKFGVIVKGPDYVMVSASGRGVARVRSPGLSRPSSSVRLMMDGTRREAGFEFKEKESRLEIDYDPGGRDNPTDLILVLRDGAALEEVMARYLERTGR